MKTVKVTFTVIAEIQVDDESCDIEDAVQDVEDAVQDVEDAVQDVEDAVRVALNQPMSLSAAAVELGAMVRSVDQIYKVQD